MCNFRLTKAIQTVHGSSPAEGLGSWILAFVSQNEGKKLRNLA